MTKLDDYLKKVKERTNRATPGPWEENIVKVTDYYTSTDELYGAGPSVKDVEYNKHMISFSKQADLDAAFIAAARQDVPKLLSIIEEMKDVLGYYSLGYGDADDAIDCLKCCEELLEE